MATVINFKRSSTQNAVPATSDLTLGELASNTYHGRMYTEKNDGSAAIIEIGTNPTSLTVNDAFAFLHQMVLLIRSCRQMVVEQYLGLHKQVQDCHIHILHWFNNYSNHGK